MQLRTREIGALEAYGTSAVQFFGFDVGFLGLGFCVLSKRFGASGFHRVLAGDSFKVVVGTGFLPMSTTVSHQNPALFRLGGFGRHPKS